VFDNHTLKEELIKCREAIKNLSFSKIQLKQIVNENLILKNEIKESKDRVFSNEMKINEISQKLKEKELEVNKLKTKPSHAIRSTATKGVTKQNEMEIINLISCFIKDAFTEQKKNKNSFNSSSNPSNYNQSQQNNKKDVALLDGNNHAYNLLKNDILNLNSYTKDGLNLLQQKLKELLKQNSNVEAKNSKEKEKQIENHKSLEENNIKLKSRIIELEKEKLLLQNELENEKEKKRNIITKVKITELSEKERKAILAKKPKCSRKGKKPPKFIYYAKTEIENQNYLAQNKIKIQEIKETHESSKYNNNSKIEEKGKDKDKEKEEKRVINKSLSEYEINEYTYILIKNLEVLGLGPEELEEVSLVFIY